MSRDFDLEKLDKASLIERIHVERQRYTKAQKAKVEREREVQDLRQQVFELVAWKRSAQNILLKMRQASLDMSRAAKGIDRALPSPPKRLLRGRKKKTPDAEVPDSVPGPDGRVVLHADQFGYPDYRPADYEPPESNLF
jgi:hypothetical protein